MATLKKVARLASVSESTASRILSGTSHGSARFGKATRERVIKIAKELKYQPNLNARALAKGRSNIIAMVYPRVVDSPFTALFIAELLAAIETRCRELDYHLLISSPYLSSEGPDESYYKLLKGGHLDGVIAFDEFPMASVLEPALESSTPTVVFGYRDYPHAVRSDDLRGTKLIIEHLLSLGHKKLGFISVPTDFHYAGFYRTLGFQKALKEVGLDYDAFPRAEGDLTKTSGAKAACYLLDNHPDITALISFNDRMAIGAMHEAQSRGLSVPNDISVSGYDNLPLTAELTPPLTTVDQGFEVAGRLAVDHLMAVMNGKSPGLKVLKPKLVSRLSSGPVNPNRKSSSK